MSELITARIRAHATKLNLPHLAALALDEVGYLPLNRTEANLVFQTISSDTRPARFC